MKNITIDNLIKVLDAKYIGPEDRRAIEATCIDTDSRKIEKDGIFVALVGERVDGHDFVKDVLSKGALCCIVEKEIEGAEGLIVVDSCADALRKMAAFYLEQMNIPVVGITGSVGKTSTKEMIASVLSNRYKVHKTAGNFNNEIGLPLTVFGIRDEHEIAVLEMGISDFGEMDRLSDIAKPDVMVITNIGPCHLEFLGDLDGVFKAKTECFNHLKNNALVVLNGDDEHLKTVKASDIKDAKNVEVMFYGKDDEDNENAYASEIHLAGVRGAEIKGTLNGNAFSLKEPLPGEHNVWNVLAALLVGSHFGMTMEEMKQGVLDVPVMPGRNHLINCGDLTVFDDCYNANPASMKSSLAVLSQEPGRTVAILGDMGELGENKEALHLEVGTYAAKADVDLVYTVGELSLYIAQAIRKENLSVKVRSFDTKEDLYPVLRKEIKSGDTILVKASHFMKFEEIVKFLEDNYRD